MPLYNNYYPQYYPTQLNPVQPQNTGITWVQGENAAKSYPVTPGQSVLLMDSENPVMYIKSTDQSGMPLPLRIFDYKERVNAQNERLKTETTKNIDYISRSEFDAFKSEIKAQLEQPVSTTSKSTSKSVQGKKEE